MWELIVLFVIVNIVVHELAHLTAFRFFRVKAHFAYFTQTIKGINLPTGFLVLPVTWDHSIRKQYVISLAGFVGSVIVSGVFSLVMPSLTEQVILIVFPVLLSIGDFKTITLMLNKPLNKSVKKAMTPKR